MKPSTCPGLDKGLKKQINKMSAMPEFKELKI